MKHFNVIFKPEGKQISIHAGATLVEAAGQAGIILNSICGGGGTCGKCVVNLEPDGREVLACQYHVQSDLTVTIPSASRYFEQKILAEGIETEVKPDIYEKYSEVARANEIFGVAVDIGTTTVVAKLINMTDGKSLATQAELNPQSKYGDDVISRIAYAATDEKSAELHKAIIDCLNKLITKLCKEAGINEKDIYEVCVVGNTTMNHIFLKFPVKQLGQAPYKAHSLDSHDLPAAQSGLHINPAGNVHAVENIASFVGSDTTAVALAADMDSAKEMTLIVDIGTNGEIVIGTKDNLYAASCAAGPALEGARISSGSRAVEGAIEAVVINEDDIDLDVIGNCPPRTICGSGLIDAVAVLLDLHIVDSTGRFNKPDSLKDILPPVIVSRICEHDGQPAFLLAEKLLLTQKDIREVQLAKAAVRAGTKILLRKFDIKDADIKQLLLAGAFGNYIRRQSALRIGLLPAVPVEKIHFIGNAAASGAQMILLSKTCRDKTKKLARRIKYVEIAHEPDFQDVFAESMLF